MPNRKDWDCLNCLITHTHTHTENMDGRGNPNGGKINQKENGYVT